MLEMLLGIAVLIAIVAGVNWVCDQISAYLRYENTQDENYFEFEPLFK